MSNMGLRTNLSIGVVTRFSFHLLFLLIWTHCVVAQATNPIVVENLKPGSSDWDIDGAGDTSIQGFATDISVNRGETIRFKVKTNATNYRLDIYRLGYYQGLGARKVATVSPSAPLPQTQPNPITDSSTGLVDCGNWAESASWVVPADATSGVYIAKLVRTDTGGASHIVFVVRDDASTSDLLFQTSDPTWQAYNAYGGNSFYTGAPAGRAYKLSYNRPLTVRADAPFNSVFSAEYPMIRWLEANGYDVSYTTGLDTDRRGNLLTNHKVFLSVGHDEYWSGGQRAKVESARNAGVDLAFFGGNDIYWRTRWEPSIDGSATPSRTLVCYKETWANAKIDPTAEWTGTWRDPRFSLPANGGGRPENELTGTLFTVNVEPRMDSIAVPSSYGLHRFWRNTGVDTLASGQIATFASGTLGYEWNEAVVEKAPPGLMRMSSATVGNVSRIQDYGNIFPSGQQATHSLTLYRHSSGSLVFSAGTVQWSWGLDDVHDGSAGSSSAASSPAATTSLPSSITSTKLGRVRVFHPEGPPVATTSRMPTSSQTTSSAQSASVPTALVQAYQVSSAADNRMRQATVNLLADMGVQPLSLQAGLTAAAQSTDTTAPSSTIVTPSPAAILEIGDQAVITGTANDSGGGQVWGVEVSTDGGTTWRPAVGRGSWSFAWTPLLTGPVTIKSRAVDDSGNLETPSQGVGVSVAGSQTTIWSTGTLPGTVDAGIDNPVELGVKFYSEVGGTVKGIRYYKSRDNTGTHVGNLWSSSGTLLASAPFVDETGSGWQQANFATPVPINSFTIYVASYHTNVGHYSANSNYFSSIGVDNSPLHAPVNGGSWGANAVYAYGLGSAFPNQTFNATNYWVDVVLQPGPPPTLTSIAVTPPSPSITTGATQQFTATGTYSDGSTQNISSQVSWSSLTPAVATINASGLASGLSAGSTTISATHSGVTGLTNLTVQTAPLTITTNTLPNGTVSAAYSATLAASGGTLPYAWSISGGALPPGLTLSPSSGTITGTPTTAGTFNFTAQVAGGGGQTNTKALSIIIATPGSTIWASSAVPGIVDGGADSPVELGVKFRSDVAGTITGIRFYKASTNTGTHVGNLWSNTGALLATGTFSGETASGWQQLNFATPVAITANTIYVASYHVNTGHYSVNTNYFASTGVDNPPLHALANGVSGGNGVYAYGASSVFPTQTFNTSNYWVDVVFQAGPAPTLSSIAVTPTNPSIVAGATQQFTATGTYSNGSTQNITSQATWTSSAAAVATVNASSGLATGVSAGTTTITAALSGVSGITTLAVQTAPLAITTASLSGGVINAAYSATLTANGGTAPYNSWTIVAGSLPTGLTLNPSSGAITGTPTTVGTFNFTVQVSDSSNPIQSATKPFSIAVSAAPSTVTVWPGSTVPGVVDGGPDSPVQLGVKFRSDVAGTIRGIRFYKAGTNTGNHVGSLWSSTGTRLATATFTGESASGWQQVNFTTPVAITANTVYVASYHTTAGHYSINTNYFTAAGADNAPLHALANGVSGGNGVYRYGASSVFPNQTWNASNYWVDVVFQPN